MPPHALLMCLLVAGTLAAEPATPSNSTGTAPAAGLPVLRADNADALRDRVGEQVILVGTVRRAEWSTSGKVMNIAFDGAEDDAFGVAIFERQRGAFDEAFGGDFAKTVAGAEVRLTGTLTEYGGSSERLKGRPELILRTTNQVTIVTPATRPATSPSTQPVE